MFGFRGGLAGQGRLFVVVSVLCACTIAMLLAAVVWLSFTVGVPALPGGPYSTATIRGIFTSAETWHVLGNTLVFAVIATAIAMIGGTALAWVVERSDYPAPRTIFAILMVVLLIPGFFPSMGWLFLLGPRIGIIGRFLHQATGLPQDAITIANPVGMAFVQGLLLVPLAFVLVGPALRAIGGELLEAAQVHGLGLKNRLLCVELPLITPALLATSIYTFMVALASFDVPGFIGLTYRQFTFSTYIFELLNANPGTPQYGPPAALGLLSMCIAFGLTIFYLRAIRRGKAYQVVSGKGYRSSRVSMRTAKNVVTAVVTAYAILIVVLPLLIILWVALSPYFQVPSIDAVRQLTLANFTSAPWSLALRGIRNTAILLAVVPIAAVLLGLIVSWVVVRSHSALRGFIDVTVFLPHAVPGIVFAMAMQSVAVLVLQPFVTLAGSIWIIAIVYVLANLSFAVRSLSATIVQVGSDLEESAYVSGLSVGATIKNVFLPIVFSAVANSWVFIALLVFRELSMAVVLFSPTNITLPTVIWSTWYDGDLGPSAAMSLVFMLLFAPLGVIYMLRRNPGQRDPAEVPG